MRLVSTATPSFSSARRFRTAEFDFKRFEAKFDFNFILDDDSQILFDDWIR